MNTLKIVLIQLMLVLITSVANSQVTTFPYHESFETGLGDWQQYSGDDFNWTRFQGATPSYLTGPNAAFDGSWYVYTEADGHHNQVSIFYAAFNFQSAGVTNPRLTFNYHMYNGLIFPPFIPNQMGKLEVIVSTDGGSTYQSIWQKNGNQGNSWYSVFLDLSAYGAFNNVYVGFKATVGTGNRSDIGVDEINVYQPVFNCITVPYLQNFNSSSNLPGLWTRDNINTWVISTAWNGLNPPTGNHLNTTVTAKKYGNVYTPCFDAYANVDIHVRFFHYWRKTAGLAAFQNGKFYGSPDGGITKYVIDQWISAITTEEGWQEYDISSWADGATRLMFWWEISGGYTLFGISGRWQLDNFEIKEGPWSGAYTWTGNVSSDWNNAGNWSSGIVPNQDIDVIIPSGVPNNPVAAGSLTVGADYGGPSCHSLTLNNGAQLSVSGYGQISLLGKTYVKTNAILNAEIMSAGWSGELYITGGSVNIKSTTTFIEGSGNMTSGSFTSNDFSFQNTGWYASGGTVCVNAASANEVSFDIEGSLNIYDLDIKNDSKVNFNGLANLGGNFTIFPTGKFNLVSGTINVTGNTYFKADVTGMAQFIDHGTINISGSSNVEEYVLSERWHYVSAPINNAEIGVYEDLYLREYFEPTDSWSYLVPVNTPMPVTKGFSVWADDDDTGTKTVVFSGSLNMGIDFPLSSLSFTPASPGVGWNLIGNPYPAPLQWNNSWTKSNIGDWACIRNNDHDECYNASTQIGWPNAGDMPNGIIPSTQGFFVIASATGANLTIPQSERVFSDQAFYKDATVAVNESIRLRIDGNEDYDAVLIQFISTATDGFDSNLDLEKRWGYNEAPQIFSITASNEAYSVNALPKLETGMIIPLGLRIGASNSYTITASQIENINDNVIVILEDILENKFIELTANSTYNFTANPGEEAHRFNIHFKDTALGSGEYELTVIQIYADNDIVYVQNPGTGKFSITIHNLMGQEIISEQYAGEPLAKIKVSSGTGYYVVRVLTENNAYSEKVFIK